MKFKHHQDFPKEKEITSLNGFTIMENVGYNKALKVCGEIDVREALDVDEICEVLLDEKNCLGIHRTQAAPIAVVLQKKFGKRDIDEEKIEYIIRNLDISPIEEKIIIEAFSKRIAKAIKKELEKI